jgi:hypothetical protein
MKIYSFKVEGGGAFPLDMLRYDRCWPAPSQDVALIIEPPKGFKPYSVELHSTINHFPTEARWNSFGWRVIEVNGKAVER